MRIRRIGLLALLFLMFVTTSYNVLAATEQNSSENITPSLINNASKSTEKVSFQGIWKVSLACTDITMAVNQSGDFFLGLCKFEGADPWNGLVAGSISGKVLYIAIAAMQGKVLVSRELTGTITDDTIQGKYVSYDSSGKQANGDLLATRINPDVSGYTPAKINVAPAPVAAEQPQTTQQTQKTVGDSSQTQKSRIKDVTELAKGIDPNIMPRHAPL